MLNFLNEHPNVTLLFHKEIMIKKILIMNQNDLPCGVFFICESRYIDNVHLFSIFRIAESYLKKKLMEGQVIIYTGILSISKQYGNEEKFS